SLQIRGNLVEAGMGKDIVQVVEDGVDAGKLIEHADGDGKKNGQTILPGEEDVVLGMLGVDGFNDVLQFLFVILLANQTKDLAGLFHVTLLDEPARAARNEEQHEEKSQCRNGRDTQLPAPLLRAESEQADHVVGEVGQQDSKDH